MTKTNENLSCPICRSEQPQFLFEGWDLLFGYPDPALVYQCRDCGHVFVAGTLTPEQLTDMYTNYYPRATFNVEEYKPYKEKKGFLYWLDGAEALPHQHVPKNVRILDIGCGYCETLGYHRTRGCDVYGVESDENARQIANQFGFNVEIGLFDPAKYEPNSFDYVTMDHVLEHLVDPLKTLQDINHILKPGGKFIASAPNPSALGRYWFGRYWLEWHLPFHRHWYSRHSIEILANASGFSVQQMKSTTESHRLLRLWGYYFCAGKPGQKGQDAVQQFGKYFSDDAKKKWYIKFYRILKKMRFLCLTMRISDMCGVGDGNLVVLEKKVE